jgi:cold shock CspA family protein
MRPTLKKGQLTTWKDDKGFGFIKPDAGGKEVFLHISALKGAGRRPKVGDMILYEQVVQLDGKSRAAKASIQGVVPRSLTTQKRIRKGNLLKTFTKVAIPAGIGLFTIAFVHSHFSPLIMPITKPGCTIKGNISVDTGDKLYHLQGMEDYESTVISPMKGERWFCSESEAIANHWRKAPK